MSSALIHWTILALAALFSLAGIVLTAFALFRDRSRGRPRCPKCWYDMSGTAGLRCPECGRDARRPKRLLKTRRRWRRAALGCCLVVIAAVTAGGQRVYEKGWVKAVPNVGYIAALPWLEPDGKEMKELHARLDSGELRQWEYRLLVRRCIRALPKADTSEKKIGLVRILYRIESNGLQSRVSKPYASWAVVSEIDGRGAAAALVPLFNDEDPDVRVLAMSALPFGETANAAIPTLLAHFHDEGAGKGLTRGSVAVFYFVQSRLSLWGRGRPKALSIPFDLYKEKSERARFNWPRLEERDRLIFERLGECGTDLSAAIPPLLELLGSDDWLYRSLAIWALGNIAPDDPDVQREVFRFSDERIDDVRKLVIGFASCTSSSDRAVDIIDGALLDPEPEIRMQALVAAAALGERGEQFQPSVRRLLEHPQARWEWTQAAITWVRIGGDRGVASGVAVKHLRDDEAIFDYRERGEGVFQCLAAVGIGSPNVLAELARLMESMNLKVRCGAAYAYPSLGGDAQRSCRVLLDVVDKKGDPGAGVDTYLARSYLFRLAQSGRLDIPTISERLGSGASDQRLEAVRLLVEAGAPAAACLPKLRELQADPDPKVASAAAEAVERLEWERDHPQEAARLREQYTRQRDPLLR